MQYLAFLCPENVISEDITYEFSLVWYLVLAAIGEGSNYILAFVSYHTSRLSAKIFFEIHPDLTFMKIITLLLQILLKTRKYYRHYS